MAPPSVESATVRGCVMGREAQQQFWGSHVSELFRMLSLEGKAAFNKSLSGGPFDFVYPSAVAEGLHVGPSNGR